MFITRSRGNGLCQQPDNVWEMQTKTRDVARGGVRGWRQKVILWKPPPPRRVLYGNLTR